MAVQNNMLVISNIPVEHWLEWEMAQGVHNEELIRRPIVPWANTLTTELHLAPDSEPGCEPSTYQSPFIKICLCLILTSC